MNTSLATFQFGLNSDSVFMRVRQAPRVSRLNRKWLRVKGVLCTLIVGYSFALADRQRQQSAGQFSHSNLSGR